jgi:hypothetical protein
MSARVTPIEVKEIMDGCTVDDVVVQSFIDAGTLLIDSVFGKTDVSDLTTQIEKWFVAHMLASTLARTTSKEKVGDAEFTYTGQWGRNLQSTPYGQMVCMLDNTGKMANIGKMAASIFAVESFTRKPNGDPYF